VLRPTRFCAHHFEFGADTVYENRSANKRFRCFFSIPAAKLQTALLHSGENNVEPLDGDTAKRLFDYYRNHRDGIRNKSEMASICLICGFAFFRFECAACGKTVDGRDPKNPGCRVCGERICICGACGCLANEY
jgi:hypothetical protein